MVNGPTKTLGLPVLFFSGYVHLVDLIFIERFLAVSIFKGLDIKSPNVLHSHSKYFDVSALRSKK